MKISGTLWSMNPERAKWKSWRSWWCASGYSACCTPFPRLSRSPATSMNFSIKNRGSGVGWQEIAGKSSFFLLVSFFKLQKQGRVPSKAARGMSRMPLITIVLIFWVAWKRLLLSWGFSSLAGVLWCSISASHALILWEDRAATTYHVSLNFLDWRRMFGFLVYRTKLTMPNLNICDHSEEWLLMIEIGSSFSFSMIFWQSKRCCTVTFLFRCSITSWGSRVQELFWILSSCFNSFLIFLETTAFHVLVNTTKMF